MDDASFFISLNLVPSKKTAPVIALYFSRPLALHSRSSNRPFVPSTFFYTSPLTHIISSSSSSRITPHSRTPSQFSFYMLAYCVHFEILFMSAYKYMGGSHIITRKIYLAYLNKKTGSVGVKEGNIKSTCKNLSVLFFVSSSRKFLYKRVSLHVKFKACFPWVKITLFLFYNKYMYNNLLGIITGVSMAWWWW